MGAYRVELAAKRSRRLSGRRRDAGVVVQEEVTPLLPAALEPPPPDVSPVERRNDALSQPGTWQNYYSLV